MHQALYRKWRPATFDEVCGQEHITDILKYETANGLFCHAYLFCGSRGTGKTTCAKILAKAVNCESPINGNPCGECESCRAIASGFTTDVLEMDAASNNKVDDIRNILDEVIYTPTALKYRVYIIDEVHMLSSSAFNALLKTLEEPPSHVVFILATTEMQKLPATIISRCQRFDFRRIATSVLTERLHHIAENEGIALAPEAALVLARLAQGGMRDAISLFELCAAGGRAVTPEIVSETVGVCGRGEMSRAVRAIAARDCGTLFDIIAEIDSSAKDIAVFWQDLISYYRDMLVVRTAKAQTAIKYLDLTDSEAAMLREDAASFSREALSYHSRLLDEAYSSMQRPGASRRTVAELALVRLCDERLGTSPEALLARISALEARLASGVIAPAPVAEAQPEEKINAQEPKPKEAARAPAAPQQRTLRPIRCWAEVIESFRERHPGVAALLISERAYTDESGKIIVCYSKEITKIMVTPPEPMAAFCNSLALALDRAVCANDVFFEKVESGKAPNDAKVLSDELGELAGS